MNSETIIFLSFVGALSIVLLIIAGFISNNVKEEEVHGLWFFFLNDEKE